MPRPAADIRAWRSLLEVYAGTMGELAEALRREHELSISDFDVLVNVPPGEQLRHGDLAERVVLSRTALTRLVDRLVDRGLLAREPDPDDHRAVRLRLTESGAHLRRRAVRTNARVVRRHLGGADKVALTALERTLHDIHAHQQSLIPGEHR